MAGVFNMFNNRAVANLSRAVFRPSVCIQHPIVKIQKRNFPVCAVDTNLTKSQVPKDFNMQFSKLIAKMLNKPEKLISVVLKTDVQIWRNGNADPTAAVHIWSIGVFDEQRNPGYSKEIIEFLVPALGLPVDRIAVMYHAIEKKDAGHLLYADMKAAK